MTEPVKELRYEDCKKAVNRAQDHKVRYLRTLLRGLWRNRRKYKYSQPHVPAKGTFSVG